MTKRMAAAEAVALIPNDAVIVVNSSRGLCCPDAELEELGNRFRTTGEPGNLTTIHPIAAGGFFGIMGVDHIVMPGCLACIIGGSYPSGPTKADPPLVWQMIMNNETGACNVQSGIVFDMLRKAAGLRPGVLTGVRHGHICRPRVGYGCAMNDAAWAITIVRREQFDDGDWLIFR